VKYTPAAAASAAMTAAIAVQFHDRAHREPAYRPESGEFVNLRAR
jgi:hypothetical protein